MEATNKAVPPISTAGKRWDTTTPLVWSMAAVAAVWWHRGISSNSRAAGAALPPRAATVAMKTPAATAMVGAQTTINDPLKEAEATVMETVMTTTIKT